ncbi:hypothetical protein G6F32_014624 [Rhizopus arrhizus]|nr:hypothetical protein G6F32_014624 [Rhizopus arrhizus]
MVADQQRGAFVGHIGLDAVRAQPVQGAHHHPAEEAHQEFGDDGEDVDRHQRVGNGQCQELLRNGPVQQLVRGQRQQGRADDEPGILDREQRHHEDAGEQADADQVDDDAEAAGLLQEGADGQPVHGGLAAAGEVQIKQERGHAERTQRHQADFHRACRQLFAQQ